MDRIRIGAQLHPQHGDYPGLRRAALRAEERGYDIVYNWDHFFPLYGDEDDQSLECWTVLAAWAEATSRIEIGPLVSCNSYRNPQLLVDMARTVDRISGGRVILGVGAGWFRRDYDEYGYDFGSSPGDRLRELERALPLMRTRLGRLQPPPAHTMPVLIAGSGERRTLRMVAEYGDSWHAGFPDRPSDLEPKVEALRRWCAEFGRDPREIEWGVGVDPEDLGRFLHEDAETYLRMGFTQFTLGFDGPGWNVDAGDEWLTWRDALNARSATPAGVRQAG